MLAFVLSFILSFIGSPSPVPAAEWCLNQPCTEIFGLTINQLSSSILVYVLACYGLYVGYVFYKHQNQRRARLYWGISLILGGLGALAAGTSFQAFAYEIKCAGKVLCDVTSTWEIAYNILSVWSAGFLLLAVVLSFLKKSKFKVFALLTLFYCASYTLLCVVAYQLGEYPWTSFEMLLLYMAPIYLIIFALSAMQYMKHRNQTVQKYLWAWAILLLVIVCYYLYLSLDITSGLWAKGIWFSANDVLHVGMLVWLYYLSNSLMAVVKDHP